MIKIVTDTGADIPRDIATHYDISIVPGYITIGAKTYRDGIDLSLPEFYQRLAEGDSYMAASEPTVKDFEALYRSHTTNSPGTALISLHSSSHLQGTYATAVQAAEGMRNAPLHPTETGQLSVGYGLMAIEAARMAGEGESFADIQYRLALMREGMQTFFTVSTMDFLVRSGRVAPVVSMLSGAFDTKPVLTLRDGNIVLQNRVRGRMHAVQALVELAESVRGPRNLHLAVAHADCEAEGRLVYERLCETLRPWYSYFSTMGAAMGVNTGPGAIVVAFWAPPR